MKNPDFELMHNMKKSANDKIEKLESGQTKSLATVMARKAEERLTKRIQDAINECIDEMYYISAIAESVCDLNNEIPNSEGCKLCNVATGCDGSC